METGIWDYITCWDYAHGVRACVLARRELFLFFSRCPFDPTCDYAGCHAELQQPCAGSLGCTGPQAVRS
eukprot:3272713-Pyramimonas_sp.AAC.1